LITPITLIEQQYNKMKKHPKILLYADSYNGRVGTSEAYMQFFSKFGEVILVTPHNDLQFLIENADVLALPGGADVDPMRYGEYPSVHCGRTNPHFEYLDKFLLEPWIATRKPIIAICRGVQTLNVTLGGSLYQHILDHVGSDSRGLTPDEIYTAIPGFHIHKVNSYHHQAIKRLAPNLEVIGWGQVVDNCPSLLSRKSERPEVLPMYVYKKDTKKVEVTKTLYYSIPEIVKHRTRPYIGFQYHPEEFNCELAIKLIKEVGTLHTINEEENDQKAEAYI
jgi:gamma-glutamyl-gamma-aminobutyrate hydrolase PuuD